MSRRLTRWVTGVMATLILVVAAACGAEPAPDAAVPQLGTTLSRVDDAIVARDWESARRELQTLVAQTAAGADSGKLTQEQAERIQSAAARLLAELPDSPPPPSLSPTPSQSDTTSKEAEGQAEKSEEDRKKAEEKRKEAEEKRKEAEEKRKQEKGDDNKDDNDDEGEDHE